MAEQSLDSLSRVSKSYSSSISKLNEAKISKAQAKRLKMPKRNRSAYFLYSMDLRAKLKVELKNSLTPLEMQAKVSQYWKDLSLEEREKYELKAKEEKIEYIAALDKFYTNLTPEILAKTNANRPKKPCSAYAHFVRDIKNDLKKQNPKLIMQEILHIASDKWKKLSKEIRITYEERAKLDKAEYMSKTRQLSINEQQELVNGELDIELIEKQNKRFFRPLERTIVEEIGTKKIKSESFSIKTDIQSNKEDMASEYVKVEDCKQKPSIAEKTLNIKALNKAEEGAVDKAVMTIPYEINFTNPTNMNYSLQIPQRTEHFNPIYPCFQTGMNLNHCVINGHDTAGGMANSGLSLATLMQANINLEDAILRRITEVQNLQAQRLYLQGKLPWS